MVSGVVVLDDSDDAGIGQAVYELLGCFRLLEDSDDHVVLVGLEIRASIDGVRANCCVGQRVDFVTSGTGLEDERRDNVVSYNRLRLVDVRVAEENHPGGGAGDCRLTTHLVGESCFDFRTIKSCHFLRFLMIRYLPRTYPGW